MESYVFNAKGGDTVMSENVDDGDMGRSIAG